MPPVPVFCRRVSKCTMSRWMPERLLLFNHSRRKVSSMELASLVMPLYGSVVSHTWMYEACTLMSASTLSV